MAVGDLVQATELSEWYNRLNTIRTVVNLPLISVPSKQADIIKAKDINDLDAEIDAFMATSQGSTWYTKPQSYAVNQGDLIRNSINSDLLTMFTDWDNTCYQYYGGYCSGDYGDCGDCGDSCHNNCPGYVCQYNASQTSLNQSECGDCPSYSCNPNYIQVSSDTGSDRNECYNN